MDTETPANTVTTPAAPAPGQSPEPPPAARTVLEGTRTERDVNLEAEIAALRDENNRLKTAPTPPAPKPDDDDDDEPKRKRKAPAAKPTKPKGGWTFFHDEEEE